MLKKVFAAAASVAIAVLACASMTWSVFADTSVDTTANYEVEVETTTDALVETYTEATTITTEATDAANVETTIREDLNKTTVIVRDIVYFEEGVDLTTADGEMMRTGMGEHIYIVNNDEANERFRVYLPKANRVLFLSYELSNDAVCYSNDGLVIGDLNYDGRVDVYDFVCMKQGVINGWSDPTAFYMADMNADGNVSVGDLVYMQRWLLGEL